MSNLTEQLDASDCPGLRQVVAGAPLQLAVARHVERVVASGVMSYNPSYMRRMGQVLSTPPTPHTDSQSHHP